MGMMASRLKRLFDDAIQAKLVSLEVFAQAKQQAEEDMKAIPPVDKLIVEGGDPGHAIYTNTLNLISLFGEQVNTLPPLHQLNDFIAKWLDIYTPALPPWSPISSSYFNCWVLLDASFGVDKETVGTCLLALLDRLQLHPRHVEAARNLTQSRMGIYEVLQSQGQFFQLRELVTDKQLTAYICSGYQGNSGDLIFIRLLPPLTNTADYYIGLTTPFLFVLPSVEDWLRYFRRYDIIPQAVGVETRLHRHLKYGKSRTYWSEYIFYGYSNCAPGVIMLTGFPDQAETQPQHRKYQLQQK